MSADLSTLSDIGSRRPMFAVWARRVVISLMVVAILTAATGLLGVHSKRVEATAGGYTLSVEYAGVARAGLDVPLRIEVASEHPFGKEITLAVNRGYFTIFETQGFHPEPSASTSQGDDVLLTFDAPPGGGPLIVDYDAYIQPSSQIGSTGRVSVMRGTGRLVTVEFATFLFP
ncbi:hypothetical protein [Nakamurella lactea]|uniref:hypothetical protein n=1 Tax=Nakamurella lactea TaxID=459515 RepID=UPI00040644F8|nr:hypothetical protein [Nakamurella lactea]